MKPKNKAHHMMSEDEFQRTVFAGEMDPKDAKHKLAGTVTRIASQYDLTALIAELGKDNALPGKG